MNQNARWNSETDKQFTFLFSQFLLFLRRRHVPIPTRVESVVDLSKTLLSGQFLILVRWKGAMIVKVHSREKWTHDTCPVLCVLLFPIPHFWCGTAFHKTRSIIFIYLISVKEVLSSFSCYHATNFVGIFTIKYNFFFLLQFILGHVSLCLLAPDLVYLSICPCHLYL